jgi:S1-C subfamily serine protease
MKQNVKFLALLLLPLITIAQKTKITTLSEGFIVRDKSENKSISIPKDKGDSKYLMAVAPGYVTQVFTTDTIVSKNVPEYKINLNSLNALDFAKVSNKILFSGFVDKLNKIKIIEYLTPYSYNFVDLTTFDFKNVITARLAENKFKVVEENEVFKSKKRDADFALAGEVLEYRKDTRGPGFVTEVVIKWSLFDIEKEETVCKVITAGYSNTQTRMSEKEVLKLAFKDALGGFMINKDVIKIIYGGEESSQGAQKTEISIPKIVKEANADNYIENAIQSSITIKTREGHGSGFLISSSGYLLTNFHVIEDSSDIQAIFQNGLTLPVQIVSFDKKADVALCKIPGKGYKPLPLDTNSVVKKIGSDVVAIGTPEDIKLGQSVTKGIISGLREIKSSIYIQTDVSINSGNSGGMLINKNGEVIGIISAKIKGEGVEGLGFAIPINKALNTLNIKIKE